MTTATYSLAVPAALVPQIRHDLHQTFGSLSAKLSDEAFEQWTATRPGEERPLPTSYRGTLKHFDRTRALLDVLGWDCDAHADGVEVDLQEHGALLYSTVVESFEDLQENVMRDSTRPREVAALIVGLHEYHELLAAAMPPDPDDPPSLENGEA